MNQLDIYIKSAEGKWLFILSKYCESLFSKVQIPSHDHTHHLRVWEYSKEIILALSTQVKINEKFIESCLVACMFHDTGLTVTLNENHGTESRFLCAQYFNESKTQKPDNFEEILNAIEIHDDKKYKAQIQNPYSIQSVLCNADDLDSFGKIGVVRYTEIYLLRGIHLNQLPELVIKNLDNRFLNFKQTYKKYPELIKNHKIRYLIARIFFEELLLENN